MTIIVVCINPEACRYLAFFDTEPDKFEVRGSSEAAIGALVKANVDENIEAVFDFDLKDIGKL